MILHTMFNFGCSSACATIVKPPVSFEKLCARPSKKKYGFRYLGFVDFGVTLADPTVLADWCNLGDSGDITISPCGKIEFSVSPTTTTDDNNCGDESILETVYDLTFETYSADPEGLAHCQYYEQLINNPCLRVILFDCAGNPYLTQEYRDFISGASTTPPTGNPGFEFTFLSPPNPTNGDGNYEKWGFQIRIKLDGTQILCPVILPGLQDCLLGDLAPAV